MPGGGGGGGWVWEEGEGVEGDEISWVRVECLSHCPQLQLPLHSCQRRQALHSLI